MRVNLRPEQASGRPFARAEGVLRAPAFTLVKLISNDTGAPLCKQMMTPTEKVSPGRIARVVHQLVGPIGGGRRAVRLAPRFVRFTQAGSTSRTECDEMSGVLGRER